MYIHLQNLFCFSVFMFIYGVYARTLGVAFMFLMIAVSIGIYCYKDKKLKECQNKENIIFS